VANDFSVKVAFSLIIPEFVTFAKSLFPSKLIEGSPFTHFVVVYFGLWFDTGCVASNPFALSTQVSIRELLEGSFAGFPSQSVSRAS
jgi:hypothetical protein